MGVGTSCPRCFARLGESSSCPACGLPFERRGGVIDLIGEREREARAGNVEAFYSRSPFPGYAAADDAGTLVDRSRRAPFLVALDAALPHDARVLDCGAGTSQLAAYLALSAPRRTVFAVDGCRASLACADAFRERAGIENLNLVRADLFDLPARPGSFDHVICRGVVHHTPDPKEATRRVAECVAPGGTLLLGFYETWARLFHRARRALARASGRPVVWLDPILRARDVDPEKQRIWIDDQYRHPLEHILPLPVVAGWLEEFGFSWVRTVPPAVDGDTLLRVTPRPGRAGFFALRAGWALRGPRDPDAGLVCLIARRHLPR
jgi:SAM-dependent methyltransferase